ncbi:unnamed protein product, partial [Ectocarpus fasciculatus]
MPNRRHEAAEGNRGCLSAATAMWRIRRSPVKSTFSTICRGKTRSSSSSSSSSSRAQDLLHGKTGSGRRAPNIGTIRGTVRAAGAKGRLVWLQLLLLLVGRSLLATAIPIAASSATLPPEVPAGVSGGTGSGASSPPRNPNFSSIRGGAEGPRQSGVLRHASARGERRGERRERGADHGFLSSPAPPPLSERGGGGGGRDERLGVARREYSAGVVGGSGAVGGIDELKQRLEGFMLQRRATATAATAGWVELASYLTKQVGNDPAAKASIVEGAREEATGWTDGGVIRGDRGRGEEGRRVERHRRHAQLRGNSPSASPPPPPPPPLPPPPPPPPPPLVLSRGVFGTSVRAEPDTRATMENVEEGVYGRGGGAGGLLKEQQGREEEKEEVEEERAIGYGQGNRAGDGAKQIGVATRGNGVFDAGVSTAGTPSKEAGTVDSGQHQQEQQGEMADGEHVELPSSSWVGEGNYAHPRDSSGMRAIDGGAEEIQRGAWNHAEHKLEAQEEPQQQLGLARDGRALAEEPRKFADGLELDCTLTVPGSGVAAGGAVFSEPLEGDVLVLGDVASVSWSLDLFDTVTPGNSSGTSSASSLVTDLDVGQVNITLFNADEEVQTFVNTDNTGTYSWTIPDNVEQSRFYRLAVWDTTTGICGITYEFAISGELSITVTAFEGYNEGTAVDISPLRRGDAASSEGGGEIYSCGGSVGVGWNFTGLLEEVNVRVCQEPSSLGSLAGLEDEDLQNPGSPVTEDGEFFICLDPVSGDVLANSSFLNASLTATAATTSDGTCGVWGEGFYAKVTWVDSGDADVFGLSNDPDAGGVSVPVLGGVFLKPNDSTPMSIAESQV